MSSMSIVPDTSMSLLPFGLKLMFRLSWPLIETEFIGVEVDGWNKWGVILGDYAGLNVLELVTDGVVSVGSVGDGLVGGRVDEVFLAVGVGLARVH